MSRPAPTPTGALSSGTPCSAIGAPPASAHSSSSRPLPSLRSAIGPYLFRADFCSASLERVDYVGSHDLSATSSPALLSTPDRFDAWLAADPQSNFRVFFHFSVSGGTAGKSLHVTIKNLNNKKPLFADGMLPVCRKASSSQWKRVQAVDYLTRKTDVGVYSFLRADDQAPGGPADGGGADQSVDEEEQPDSGDDLPSTDQPPVVAAANLKSSPASSPTHSRGTSASGAVAPKKAPAAKAKAKKAEKHDTMELIIQHTFDDSEEVFFAFCVPHSYAQLQDQLLGYERKFASSSSSIFFHRELLTTSLEGRRIDLVTISNQRGRLSGDFEPDLPHLYPTPSATSSRTADIAREFPRGVAAAAAVTSPAGSRSFTPEARCASFAPSKPIAFLSARVHPGETPSAHMMNGLLEWALHPTDPRAAALRDNFVLKIIPCLNPDGVAHGWYRTDSLGHNLNRFYESPDPVAQPSIFAARSLVESLHARRNLFCYIDLHAHAQKRGLFVFGNHLPSEQQARNVSFAKLLQLNSPALSIDACNFTRANMHSKDARDGLSKEGSGRVAFLRLTGIPHCYTVEVNYHHGRVVNQLAPLPKSTGASAAAASAASASPPGDLSWQRADDLQSQESLSGVGPSAQYTIGDFEAMGKALLVSMLDLAELNPFSRLPASEYASYAGVERWARAYSIKPPKRLIKRLTKKTTASTPKASPQSSPRA